MYQFIFTQVITSDGAIVEIGADIFFRVKDPVLSVSSIQDLNHSLRIIAVASLQKHFSKIRLNHIESDKSVTSSLLHVGSILLIQMNRILSDCLVLIVQ